MRSVTLLAILACSSPLAAMDSPLVAANQVRMVDLPLLQAAPASHAWTTVRFRCIFAELADIYDVHKSRFRSERFFNIAVWDYRARLHDAEVRGAPFVKLFLAKERIDPRKLKSLTKFQVVEITGRVRDVVDGQPEIEVDTIAPVQGEGVGAWTSQAIYHTEQALQLAAKGARDLAEEHFSAAMRDHLPVPARIDLGTLRGRELLASGRHQEALDVLSRVLSLAAADAGCPPVERAQVLALLAKAQGELAERNGGQGRDQAVDFARRALANDPSLGEAYAVLGIGLAGLGQYDEARRQCDIAVRLRPGDAEVAWYLGRILDLQGKHSEAIDSLRRAIDLTPKDARIHKSVAVAYLHRAGKGGARAADDLGRALGECDISLRLAPGDAEALVLGGQVIEAAAKAGIGELPTSSGGKQKTTLDQAVQRYQQAIQADAKCVAAYRALGDALIALGQTKEALATAAQLKSASSDKADQMAAATIAGRAHWAADDPRAALAELTPVESELTDPSTLIVLGWSQLAVGNQIGAKAVADRLVKAELPAAYELRGWVAAQTGDLTVSEELLRKADLAPAPVKGYRLGMVLFRQGPGRWPEAKPLLESAKGITGQAALFAGAQAEVAAALKAISAPPVQPGGSTTKAVPAAEVPVRKTGSGQVPTVETKPVVVDVRDGSAPASH